MPLPSRFRTPEQEEYADCVFDALKHKVSFINCPGGVGKTRGYLIPLLSTTHRILISVPTTQLIEQFLESTDLKATRGSKNVQAFYSKLFFGNDEVAYLENKELCAAADIVLATHAMVIRDRLTGGKFLNLVSFDVVIFDEADKLPDAASLQMDGLISNYWLKKLDTEEPGEIIKVIKKLDKPNEEINYIKSIANMMLNNQSEDEWGTIARTSSGLEIKFKNPAKILKKFITTSDTVIIMTSGTLCIDDDFSFFENAVGIYDAKTYSVDVSYHGTLSFTLADRCLPKPGKWSDSKPGNKDDRLFNTYWSTAIKMADEAGGNVLVLSTSSAITHDLHKLVSGTRQEKGEKLSETLFRYQGGILILHSGWEGLDCEFSFSDIIIPKVPFPPPDEVLILTYLNSLQKAIRKLNQGFSRGIRSQEQACHIWMLDPRFPVPKIMVDRGEATQQLAANMTQLVKAIPKRFRLGRKSAFSKADILKLDEVSVFNSADGGIQ